VFEENEPPILIFANSLLPNGESTSDLISYYEEKMNEEVAQVNLVEIDFVPEEDANVDTVISEAAEIFMEEAEKYEEEHMEAFASYYVYDMDASTNSYSIGVYGN